MQDKRTPFLREGFEASETNVNAVLAKISYDGLAEAMTEAGWEIITHTVRDVLGR